MEETGTNKNDPASPASFILLDPRKRKKDTMEKTETQVSSRPRLDLGWKQTEEEIQIQTKVDARDGDVDKVEVFFTEREMTITLPDGQQQVWCFHGAIDQTCSKVCRSKRRFSMTVVKKERGMWPSLEASQIPQPSQDAAPEEEPQQVEENPEMVSPSRDLPDSLQELRTKEEEPVLNLHHIKHDFFERDDTLTIHIYVKNVSKDVVKIHFDKQSFTVKFQTGDAKFLQLHEGASEETVFCWRVNTKSHILPAGCKWKTTSNCIELRLKKATTDRWSNLEAPLKKEPVSASKSTSWMPAKPNMPTASTSKAGSSSVVFDEMSQLDDNRRGLDPLSMPAATASPLHSASAKGQKPTAKVHPLNTQVTAQERRTPQGYTGLTNMGNTCYMNSVIQVLANTSELRDFFMGGQYKEDLHGQSGGELARCFAALLKTLWKGDHEYIMPTKLKELVSRRGSVFSGYFQHDAQEFLSYLLVGLHEDLNRAKKAVAASNQDNSQNAKGVLQEKGAAASDISAQETNDNQEKDVDESDANKPVHVMAEEKWSADKKRDDSFLVDLMYGQYKNKITCPSCKEVSTTFEPFSILPLALPKSKMTLTVTFIWRDAQRRPIKYQVLLVKDSTVEHLTEQLSHKTGVHPKNMRVYEVKNSLFYRRFNNSSDLARVDSKDLIIVSEVLSAVDAGEDVVELEVIQRTLQPRYPVSCSACKKECQSDKKLKRCTSCFKVGYCNHVCQRNHWYIHRPHCFKAPDPVGCPFVLSLPRSHCTYSRIARLMESFARYSVDTFQPPVKADPVIPPATTPPPPTTPSTSSTSTSTTTPPKTSSSSSSGSLSGTMLPPSGELHLPSHPSGSNLSSSSGSQSSGSLSSLDSISSCSSTATLTAETPHATFDVGHSGGEEEEGEEESRDMSRDECGGGDVDSGLGSVSSFQSGGSSQACSYGSAQGDWKQEGDQEKNWAGSYSAEKSGVGSNVQSVAASMSSERSVPLFFIKPVDAEGRGRRVERLEDKGDTVLDMSSNRHLSMDWRNNENQSSYVLVQSKELEAEEDDSVKNPRHVSETLTLQQCLDLYHAPEILSDRNAWTCEKCKQKQEALKQCYIWKMPHIFIVQLKRFRSFDMFTRKIETKVEFPVRGLDLTPYKYQQDSDPALYDLYGVVSHMGHTIGGHYTCYARCVDPSTPYQNEVEWRLFNDSQVSRVNNEKSVVDKDAYVLFYRRRQVFVPPPPVARSIAAAPEVEPVKKDVREKSEEEPSKEERSDRESMKVNGDVADEGGEEAVQESQEEKQDPEKDDSDDGQFSCSEGGRLVIDMEPSHQELPLGYTDMDAVD